MLLLRLSLNSFHVVLFDPQWLMWKFSSNYINTVHLTAAFLMSTHLPTKIFYLFLKDFFSSLKDEYQLVRDCVCGQIYDSSPVDFTSDLGTRFVLHPSILKMSHPPRVVSWMAKALASGLDTLFINRFEAQRSEYWQTLYSSAVRL